MSAAKRWETRGREGSFGVWDRSENRWAVRPTRTRAEADGYRRQLYAAGLR